MGRWKNLIANYCCESVNESAIKRWIDWYDDDGVSEQRVRVHKFLPHFAMSLMKNWIFLSFTVKYSIRQWLLQDAARKNSP